MELEAMSKIDKLLTYARGTSSSLHDVANEIEEGLNRLYVNAEKQGRAFTNNEFKLYCDSHPFIGDLRGIEEELDQIIKRLLGSAIIERLETLLDIQEEELKDDRIVKPMPLQKRAYKDTIILTDCGACNFIIELDNKKDLEKALKFEQYARSGKDERARELDELTSIELIEMYLKDNKIDYSIKNTDNFDVVDY